MVPLLRTPRLMLQEILPGDQAFIFEGLSHPDVIPFYGVRYDSLEATAAQMDWYSKMVDEGSGTPWKIVDATTSERIGVVCVYNYNQEHNKAEIGFWVLPAFWGTGFAAEALEAVIHYWRHHKALHRLEAFVEEGNKASIRLLEKKGFRYEGTMRDCEVKNGNYISLLIYALIFQGDEIKREHS